MQESKCNAKECNCNVKDPKSVLNNKIEMINITNLKCLITKRLDNGSDFNMEGIIDYHQLKSLKGSNVIAHGKRSATLGLGMKSLNITIRAGFEIPQQPCKVNLPAYVLKAKAREDVFIYTVKPTVIELNI